MATNHYETLISLEQATEAITTSLLKCEFYHRLYVSFAETSNSQMSDSKKIFDCLEGRLPELYALVIELSVKSVAYMGSSGRQSNEVLLVLTDIIVSYLVLSVSFQPFSLKFRPLLDDIATQERDLKELAGSLTAMAAISMWPFIEIHYHLRNLSLFYREFNMPGENEE